MTADRDGEGAERRQYRTFAVGPDGREAHGVFVNPLAPWMVDAALSSIAAAGKTLQRSVLTHSLDPVRDLGVRLYQALFSGSIERAFDRALESEGEARVRLVLEDEQSMAIPWEFLYDHRRNDFLVLSTRTPLVRSVSPRSLPSEPPEPGGRVSVLAAASDITGTWGVESEMSILRTTLGSMPGVALEILTHASWRDVHLAFRELEPDVVHLVATGAASQITSGPFGGQTLAFVSENATSPGERRTYSQVAAADLVDVLADSPRRPRLLVLNGCRTDTFAARLAPFVPGVVGHRGDITDASALAFTEGLYGALARGVPLDAAVTAARLRVDAETPGGREWCAPVLYQQDGAVAFPPPSQAPSRQHLLTRPPREVAPRRGTVAPSRDDRALQVLQSLLAIHQANLEAMLTRIEGSGDATRAYTEREIENTRGEVERLRGEMAAREKAIT